MDAEFFKECRYGPCNLITSEVYCSAEHMLSDKKDCAIASSIFATEPDLPSAPFTNTTDILEYRARTCPNPAHKATANYPYYAFCSEKCLLSKYGITQPPRCIFTTCEREAVYPLYEYCSYNCAISHARQYATPQNLCIICCLAERRGHPKFPSVLLKSCNDKLCVEKDTLKEQLYELRYGSRIHFARAEKKLATLQRMALNDKLHALKKEIASLKRKNYELAKRNEDRRAAYLDIIEMRDYERDYTREYIRDEHDRSNDKKRRSYDRSRSKSRERSRRAKKKY